MKAGAIAALLLGLALTGCSAPELMLGHFYVRSSQQGYAVCLDNTVGTVAVSRYTDLKTAEHLADELNKQLDINRQVSRERN